MSKMQYFFFAFATILLLLLNYNSKVVNADFESNMDDELDVDAMESMDMGLDGTGDDYGRSGGSTGYGGNYDPYSSYSYDGYGDHYGGGGGYGSENVPPRELESVEDIKEFVSEDGSEPAIIGYFSEDNEEDKVEEGRRGKIRSDSIHYDKMRNDKIR